MRADGGGRMRGAEDGGGRGEAGRRAGGGATTDGQRTGAPAPVPEGEAEHRKGSKFDRAVNKATKFVVSGAAAAVLLYRRDEHVAWCLLGAVCAAFVNKGVKRLINAPRPAGARKADPGMPSSHAQSLAYLSSYLAIFALSHAPLAAAGVLALGAYLAWLRVATGLHTAPQVVVGFGVGVANASLFGSLGEAFGGVSFVQSHPLALACLWSSTALAVVAFAVAVARKWTLRRA